MREIAEKCLTCPVDGTKMLNVSIKNQKWALEAMREKAAEIKRKPAINAIVKQAMQAMADAKASGLAEKMRLKKAQEKAQVHPPSKAQIERRQ